MAGLWTDDDEDGIEMFLCDPRSLSRRNQRRYVRERIALQLVAYLKRDVTYHGTPWVNALIGEGLGHELIEDEARRMAHRIKVAL